MLNNNKKGFTLLEGIIAIFLITIGIGAAYNLISQTISSANIASQKLTAAYLAQEGIEIVRNIRDNNWLSGNTWNQGLAAGFYQADYKNLNLSSYNNIPLNLENSPSNLYGYNPGIQTKFKRKIIISVPATPECPADDCFLVKIEIEWQDRGRTYIMEVQENLYNWTGR